MKGSIGTSLQGRFIYTEPKKKVKNASKIKKNDNKEIEIKRKPLVNGLSYLDQKQRDKNLRRSRRKKR